MPLPYQSLPSLQTAAIDPLFSLGGEDDAELTPTERSPHPPLESGSSSSSLANTGGPSAVRSEGRRLRPDEMNIRPYSDDDLGIVTGTSGTQLRSVSPLAWGLKSTTASRELEYELDDDQLSEGGSDATINAAARAPLLVGLLNSQLRRSQEIHIANGGRSIPGDLDEEGAEGLGLHAGGGLISGIANMANSILGAGIIGLPYALASAGLVTGLFLLVSLCLVTDWTIRLIVLNAKLSGRNSYIEIMGHCFGEWGRGGVSFFQFAFAFGGMCAFGVIIGDTIPHVIAFLFPFLQDIPVLKLLVNRSFIIFLATSCVSYPLSLHRDIHKLSKASGIALLGMLIICCSVLIEGSRVDDALKGNPEAAYTIIRPRVVESIGVIAFAFVCHHNSLLIYGSLKVPTLDRFAQVTHISTALSLIMCLAMSLSGFLVFTDKTQANILNNFPQSDILINLARLCFGLNMFTTLPLETFVCREVIESYFYAGLPFDQRRHVIITTAIVFSTMAISLMTCDLGILLELTGGLSATVLAFIFPAICFLRLSDAPTWSRQKLPAWLCASFGAIVMVISVGLSLAKAFTGGGGEGKTCS